MCIRDSLYPCHQFVGNEDFLMGNVFEGLKRTDIRDSFKSCNVYSKEKCRECFARFYCSGGCAANSYNFHGDIHNTYDIGCALQKKRVECAIMIKEMCIRDSLYMNALFTADLADGAYVNRNETLSESEVNEIIENMNSWRYDLAGFNSKLPEDEWAFIKKYNKYTDCLLYTSRCV